ncbi:hypothetical protein L0337_35495 [candidate division KSB1 bacterium]|nr:hypothetical protein [candidate division KSB1 bacterium]
MKAKSVISKRQLRKHLDELIALAKSVTPDVQTEILIPGDEGQHAWLKVFVPDELEERVHDLIVERANDIFIETGYDIAAIAYEKSRLQSETAETEGEFNDRS